MTRRNTDETLSTEALSLLHLEKTRPDDSRLPKTNISAKLSETLGFSLDASSSNQIPTSVATSAQAGSTLLKSLLSSVALFVSGAVVGGTFVHLRENRQVEVPPSTTPSTTPTSPAAEIAPEVQPSTKLQNEPTPPKTPLHQVVPKPSPKSVLPEKNAVPAPDSTLQLENASLERARTALLRNALQDALWALDDHERNFPNGKLAEERDVLRIQVLISLGRKEEAKAFAATLGSKYPDSLMLPAVKTLIEENTP